MFNSKKGFQTRIASIHLSPQKSAVAPIMPPLQASTSKSQTLSKPKHHLQKSYICIDPHFCGKEPFKNVTKKVHFFGTCYFNFITTDLSPFLERFRHRPNAKKKPCDCPRSHRNCPPLRALNQWKSGRPKHHGKSWNPNRAHYTTPTQTMQC